MTCKPFSISIDQIPISSFPHVPIISDIDVPVWICDFGFPSDLSISPFPLNNLPIVECKFTFTLKLLIFEPSNIIVAILKWKFYIIKSILFKRLTFFLITVIFGFNPGVFPVSDKILIKNEVFGDNDCIHGHSPGGVRIAGLLDAIILNWKSSFFFLFLLLLFQKLSLLLQLFFPHFVQFDRVDELRLDLFDFQIGIGLAQVTDFWLVEHEGSGLRVNDRGCFNLGEINLHREMLFFYFLLEKK